MKPTTICVKCERYITNNNLSRHVSSCGLKRKSAKIRGIDYDPNTGYKTGKRKAWNKGLTKENTPAIERQSITVLAQYKNGRKPKGVCVPEWYTSDAARVYQKRNGGYRENAGRGLRFKVVDSFGTPVTLQSSYEKLMSEILDELGVRWTRPEYLNYGNRKYFPDFLLVDYAIYLDTKNDFLIGKDHDKIEAVVIENQVKLLVVAKRNITIEFVKNITGV